MDDPIYNEHVVWPWNPELVFCPSDGEYHKFGCTCVRENPDLLPGALRSWYMENWNSRKEKYDAGA